jgi:glycosyltransferase involved in cell wall biosynthesis
MRRRLTNYLSYLMLAIPRALTINADVILAMTDPPMAGIAGALVASLRRRPFLYNIQDLHPDMALASGLVRPGPLVSLWEKLHCWALRRADRLVVLGDDMRERVIAKGVEPGRVVVVRTGATIPETLASREHSVVQEIRCGFPFVVLHAGNLGFYGAWETLIAAARLLDREDVGFIFVGDGADKPAIKALSSSCHRVRFLPFRPPEEVPCVLSAADAHVVTVRRGLEGMVVPSKLYPILAAGRPVLAVAPENSDVARIVARSGCGVIADPDDPASVAAAIRMLVRDKKKLEQMAERARAIAPEYERKKQLERFVQLTEQIGSS